jgi:hypothetical protein
MKAARRLALALVHHPVLDREGGVITTAITNLDMHDIARSARTYGLEAFYVVHPVEAQRELVERLRSHWTEGGGAKRIPDRKEALALVRIVPSLDEAIGDFGGAEGPPELWTTAARARGSVEGYGALRARLETPGPPVLLLFGTGWGLVPELQERAAVRIAPIAGVGDWNHLSVRGACAITLDRLLGSWA